MMDGRGSPNDIPSLSRFDAPPLALFDSHPSTLLRPQGDARNSDTSHRHYYYLASPTPRPSHHISHCLPSRSALQRCTPRPLTIRTLH
ncbi:hypothetical protein E2C01_036994 [Portunus trituberculatus]|uniref:Uncharacterized protein n=1 Tax=Portunus trituberculatus TaxID=210409 RepID=A0A5B7FDK6_PORTR|nr:hypothetical protein [Portunus trituberculatus]